MNTNTTLNAHAMEEMIKSLSSNITPAAELEKSHPGWWSVTNAMTISTIILVFGLMVLALASFLIRSGSSADSVLRVFGTILIVIGAIFLIVAGYGDTQIAPAMGLLGTIAGYLLGKETPKATVRESNEAQDK